MNEALVASDVGTSPMLRKAGLKGGEMREREF